MLEQARSRRSGVTGPRVYDLDDRTNALASVRSAPKLVRLLSPASRVQRIDQLLGYEHLIACLLREAPRKARPTLGGLSGFPKGNRFESREITSGSPEQAGIVFKVTQPCIAMHAEETAYLARIMAMVLR
jgi:hypothetical protein